MSLPEPYYADESVTLYHGDCREVTEWLAADVLVTDPPYGRNWQPIRTGSGKARSYGQKRTPDLPSSIVGDKGTSSRDAVLELWGDDRPAVVFGDLAIPAPGGRK